MNLEDSYKNPFAAYNANKMDSDTILSYWCNPFAFRKSSAIRSGSLSENEVLSDSGPIVFIGGRGTGKTMFLKYFSYMVQRQRAKREVTEGRVSNLIDYLNQIRSLGLYVKIDGPLLRSFRGKSLPQDIWDEIFAHYFELRVCLALIEVLADLTTNRVITVDQLRPAFLPGAANCLHVKAREAVTLKDLIGVLNNDLEAVTKYRSDVVFTDVKFRPRQAFSSGDLFRVIKLAQDALEPALKKILFPIYLDEYENFSTEQQRRINTLVKHVPDATTFRIGMRFEGFHTYDTINENEFIKRGRDYQEMVFEEVLIKDKDYEQFLLSVAQKRLEAVSVFRERGFVRIDDILGKRASLEEEALELTTSRRTRDQHFNLLRSSLSVSDLRKAKKVLAYPDNPLLEMLNILWVIRGTSIEKVAHAMKGYLAGDNEPLVAKYRMDYVHKYKLALTFLLCSAHKGSKKYYSFNTFTFLSSGIVGNFIELCRRSFQLAYFAERDRLFADGKIAADIQDTAAKEASAAELEMVTRIHEHGDTLYRFVCNLGNIFRAYHTDIRLKYIETNQFSVDAGALRDSSLKAAFKAAVEWSVVQKKPRLQRTSPDSARRVIYTLNRVFAPTFELTYRTRGQFSEAYSEEDIRRLMLTESVKPKADLAEIPTQGTEQADLPLGEGY